MDKRILFETSPWFVILCLLAGLGYAFLLYKGKNPWTGKQSLLLGAARFITVSIITFLLLGPLVRQIQNTIIEPAVVVSVDNSRSIEATYTEDELNTFRENLGQFMQEIPDEDYEVEFRDLSGEAITDIQELTFNQDITNLSAALKTIENDYEGRNLSRVILISDGIYNQGISPIYTNYPFPVYSVGVGDTVPKRDIILKSVIYNKIVYQGNLFPLRAEVANNGFRGRNINVEIIKDNRVVDSRNITLDRNDGIQEVEFQLTAENSGIQRYRVSIRPLDEEFSTDNNIRDAFIEVVEGKNKILFLAPAPHPDIKPLRNVIEKNENFEVDLVVNGIHEYREDQYDLAILHQLPDRKNTFGSVLERLQQDEIPALYILGSQVSINQFNRMNGILSISPIRNQYDLVFPSLNPDYTLFNIEDGTRSILADLPPLSVPFGEYTLTGNLEVLLNQRVGKVTTNKPLLVISKNQARKEAVLTGEGLWQWRLHEFSQTQDFEGFDDLFGKVIQYLNAKEDKRKFRVYPVKNENRENEPVIFETEIYNDIYEEVYGHKIELTILSESDSTRNFTYVTSPANTRFRVSGLNPGVYRYQASSKIEGELRQAEGMFSVEKMQLETITLTANHNLLNQLADRTGGEFYRWSDTNQLMEDLGEPEDKSMIISSEKYLAIINMKWLFFFILLLITLEWGFRKYLGGY